MGNKKVFIWSRETNEWRTLIFWAIHWWQNFPPWFCYLIVVVPKGIFAKERKLQSPDITEKSHHLPLSLWAANGWLGSGNDTCIFFRASSYHDSWEEAKKKLHGEYEGSASSDDNLLPNAYNIHLSAWIHQKLCSRRFYFQKFSMDLVLTLVGLGKTLSGVTFINLSYAFRKHKTWVPKLKWFHLFWPNYFLDPCTDRRKSKVERQRNVNRWAGSFFCKKNITTFVFMKSATKTLLEFEILLDCLNFTLEWSRQRTRFNRNKLYCKPHSKLL